MEGKWICATLENARKCGGERAAAEQEMGCFHSPVQNAKTRKLPNLLHPFVYEPKPVAWFLVAKLVNEPPHPFFQMAMLRYLDVATGGVVESAV